MNPSGTVPGNSDWLVNWPLVPEADRDLFESATSLLTAPKQQVTLDRRSGVSRLSAGVIYYVKTFQARGSRLKHAFGISRFQRELRNLDLFNKLGLNTPALVAHGQWSRLGLWQGSVLVTREVADARDLGEILEAGDFYRDGVSGARAILDELARATRAMHMSGFHHRDLKPRNVLLRREDSGPALYFFDCPSGHRPPGFMWRRCMLRDLAHLEEGLRGHLRSVDMLYLFKRYRDCEILSAEDKTLAREVLRYQANRSSTRRRRRREREKQA
jgi:serine/threonine protein kinase